MMRGSGKGTPCNLWFLLDQLAQLSDMPQNLLHTSRSFCKTCSLMLSWQRCRLPQLLTSLLLMRRLAASAAFSSAVRALFLPATLDMLVC